MGTFRRLPPHHRARAAKALAGTALTTLFCAGLGSGPARAQTWIGTSSDFNTASNWNPAAVPSVGQTATFGGGSLNTTVNVTSAVDLGNSGGLTFAADAAAHTININQTLFLTDIANDSTQNQTINILPPSGGANVYLTFRNAGTAYGVTINQYGDNGVVEFPTSYDASGSAFTLSSTNGGMLVRGTDTTVKLGSLNSVGNVGRIDIQTGGNNNIIEIGALNRNDVFRGYVTQADGASGGLRKVGTGTMTLGLRSIPPGSTVNPYSGPLEVVAGTLNVETSASFGAATGGTFVSSGATLGLLSSFTVGSEAFSLAGSGVGNGGALRNVSGDHWLGGAVTLTADTRINSDANLLTLQGAIGQGGYSLTFGGAGKITATNTISGSGELVKDGTGTLTLTGDSSGFAGFAFVEGGTLAIAQGGKLGSSSGDIASAAGSVASATVTGAGSAWTSTGALYVGYAGNGTLTVSDGGKVSNATGRIAFNDTSVGSATVTGAGSTWTNSGNLTIGKAGNGTLTVEAGGQVSNALGIIGYDQGAVGTVTVTGPDSAWANSSNLYVGNAGNGALTVSDGGTVSSAYGYIAYIATSESSATVTGAGSTWTNTGGLYVGDDGNGTLTVSEGGQVFSAAGVIADSLHSVGTATVTGANSAWTNTGNLFVGNVGNGTLTVSDGGTVSNSAGHIGYEPDSVGTATVTGAGSTWTNTGGLHVGTYGNGTLTVSEGGQVFSAAGVIADSLGSVGTATVTGANSAWTNTGNLFVGNVGNGTLTVSDGGTVSNTDGYIAAYTGSEGHATVTGAGSTWTNTDRLYVGTYGNGTLTVGDSGTVQASSVRLGSAAVGGTNTGTLNIGAAVGEDAVAAGVLDTANVQFRNGTSTLNFNHTSDITFAAALSSTGDGTHALNHYAGVTTLTGDSSSFTGTTTVEGGTLQIAQGGKLGGTDSHIGRAAGSDGTAIVSGTGSAWDNANTLTIGDQGTGTLTIADGGKVSNIDGHIGRAAGSDGTVVVSGAGSAWNNANTLMIGNEGTGTLTIEDGGKVSSKGGLIGYTTGSGNGTVTVSGPGSTWTNTDRIYVSYGDTGTLTVTNGGKVTSESSIIGFVGTGTTTVSGAGSTFTNTAGLNVGNFGSGTLNVSEGGVVSAPAIVIGTNNGSTGTVNIGAAAGSPAVAAGTLDATSIAFQRGTGALNFNHTDTITFAAALSSTGDGTHALNHYAGTTTLTGDSSGFAGTTTVEGGTLLVGDASGNGKLGGSVHVGSLGTLGGSGTILGATTIDGTLSAGNSPGTLTFADDLTLNSGSTSVFELNSPGVVGGTGTDGNDLVVVHGDLTLDGTLDARVASAGYYRLFDYDGTLSGTFADGTVTGTGGFTPTTPNNPDVQYGIPGQVNLSVLADGQTMQFWDGTDTTGNGVVDGGAGTWSTAGTNWTGRPGEANVNGTFGGSVGVFAGPAGGSVTVDGTQSFDTLQFSTNGYTLQGGALALGVAGGGTLNIDSGISTTIATTIGDGGGSALRKTGGGTLILSGTNTYTGGTTLLGGVLSVSTDANLGAASGGLAFDGGTLATTASFDTTRAITLTQDGRFDVASATTLGLNGAINGNGALVKQGDGTLTLGGVNTYTGGTTLVGGVLSVSADANLGAASGGLAFDGGTLATTASFDTTRAITLTQDGRFDIASATTLGLNGAINGNGALVKQGSGTLTLGGVNDYTGGTTVEAGTLVGNTDSIRGDIANAGSVIFDQGSDASFGGSIAGFGGTDGTMTKRGAGILTLAGTSSLDWGIEAGGLVSASDRFSGDAAIGAGASLTFDQTTTGTYAGVLSGDGRFIKAGSGTVALSGTNTYTGGTTLLGGVLSVSADANLGAASGGLTFDGGTLATTASFDTTRAITLTQDGRFDVASTTALGLNGDIAGNGALVKQGDGTLTLGGVNSYTGGTTVEAGTLVGNTDSIRGDIANAGSVIFDQGSDASFGGGIAGFGGTDGTMTKRGAGILTLAGTSSLDWGIEAGGLVSASDRFSGNAAIGAGASLTFDQTTTGTYAGVLSGDGRFIKAGTGTVLLSGTNTYTGGTALLGGVLSVSADANLGAASGGLTFDGGTLATTASFDTTRAITLTQDGRFDIAAGTELGLGGAVSGAGDVVKGGGGTLVLSGANSYGGNTLVEAGTLVGNASSIRGHIGNAGTVVLDQAGDASFAGDIAGLGGVNGAMVKRGAGDLTLAGTSGLDWTVEAGGLISASERFGGNAAIEAGASLTFDQGADAVYGGVLSGAGSFNKTGAGALGLSADSSAFAGSTFIENGTLAVDGQLGGTLDVGATARLQGIGTVGDTTVNGTIAPGNGSIGTINVADITFNAGSIYEVEVNTAGQSDRITASGTATLNGGSVQVLNEPGVYTLGSRNTILSAADGVSGTFAGVTQTSAFTTPFLSFALVYDPNAIYLDVGRSDVTFASAGQTRNQIATGGGLDTVPLSSPLIGALVQLDVPSARAAFDQLSGEIHASAKTAMIEDSRFIRNAVNDRIRAAFDGVGASSLPVMAYGEGGPQFVPATTDRLAVWGQGFGSWGNTNGNGNAARLNRSTSGFFIGADAPVFETSRFGPWRFGAVAGYSHSTFDAKDRHSSGWSDNYHLGLYGGTTWGALALRTGTAYTWHDISTSRGVSFPGFFDSLKGDTNAGTAQVFGELGYGIHAGNLAFEPFANLAWVSLHTDGFTERGGASALNGQSATTDATFTTLGLRASTTFDLNGADLTAKGTLGWRHAFGDVTPLSAMRFAGGDTFTIAGVPIARDAAVVEAGLDYALSSTATLGVTYGGQFGSGATDQSFRANFSVRF